MTLWAQSSAGICAFKLPAARSFLARRRKWQEVEDVEVNLRLWAKSWWQP